MNESKNESNKGLIAEAITALKDPNELTKDITSPAAKEIGQVLGDLIYSSTLFIKKWRVSSEAKLKKYQDEITEELSKIPVDKLVEPKLSIVGPAIEASKYYIDEDQIRSMFAKLIAAASNSDNNDAALPAFVEILKQLSPFDVKNILELYKIHNEGPSTKRVSGTIRATINPSSNFGVDWIADFIPFEDLTLSNKDIYGASLDNLTRLALIKIEPNYKLEDDRFQNQLEEHRIFKDVKERHELQLKNSPTYDTPNLKIIKGIWSFTNFGELFIKCCIQEDR